MFLLPTRSICFLILCCVPVTASALWWEHPHDKWYLKDDWKAGPVDRYQASFDLPDGAASGWIVIWGERGVILRINGRQVMQHVDSGIIYDADLTGFVAGATQIRLEAGPGKIVAEGEWIDQRGGRYAFGSGCEWTGVAGARLKAAARPYRPGNSSGAFNTAHNGLLLRYNLEERGKTSIAKTLARIQKLQDQSIFLLRRHRSASDILGFTSKTLWRSAENFAAEPIRRAQEILEQEAIPAQKNSEFQKAIVAAGKAGEAMAAAELAIAAATQLELAERERLHLESVAELLPRFGKAAPAITHDLEEIDGLLAAAGREAGWADWANVGKQTDAAEAQLRRLRDRLVNVFGGAIGQLDNFSEDRFGWLNCRALNRNDPADFDFSTAPPDSNWIDLRGWWQFRTDPANQGEKSNWPAADARQGWRSLRVPGEWERQQVQDENDSSPWDAPYKIDDARCDDKPYNGFAWYRRELKIPPHWSGRDLVLRLGKVANWARLFVNGKAIGNGQMNGGEFRIPAGSIHAAQRNTITIQVYNHNNFGGIIEGPVALSLDGKGPKTIVTPGPLSFTTETRWQTHTAVQNQTALSPALSPIILFATDSNELNLWAWEAKGIGRPDRISFGATNSLEQRSNFAVDAKALGADWLLLSAAANEALRKPRDLLIIFRDRPQRIGWETNELGYAGLTIRFAGTNNLLGFLQAPDAETKWSAEECERWAARAHALPVASSELAALDRKDFAGKFALKYHYLDWPGFAGKATDRIAPVPALLSLGIQSGFPGLELGSAAYATNSGYWFRAGSELLEYKTPLPDKTKLLKGVGELFAKKSPQENSRGGNNEYQMFEDWRKWGFDHCRYAFAWNQDWDIPLQKRLGGPISEDLKLWQRMDELVREHTSRGIMAMLCYFFNEDTPQRDSRGLVRNSTRYWRMHPETRTNIYELWGRIAQRYSSYPKNLIAYDFLNEPAYMHTDDWNQIIADLTRIVRAVDPHHLIVCEAGDGWSQPQWFRWLKPTGDTNTIYSFHHYGKHWGYAYDEYYPSYQSPPERLNEVLLEVIQFGIEHNVPMHCGEFGVSMISPGEDHLIWLDDYLGLLERFGIGWNWWNWDGNGIYRTGLKAGGEVSPNLKILQKWIDRKTNP